MFPYAYMAQALYSPLSEPPADNLAATKITTAEEIVCMLSVFTFVASQKIGTLGVLPEAVWRPAAALLQTYV